MNIKYLLIFLFFLKSLVIYSQTIVPKTEGWRVHGAYKTNNCIEEVEQKIVVGNNSSMFLYNKTDNSLEVESRVTGLSDVNVQILQYHATSKTLLIAYDNLNIDLVQNNVVYNISDIFKRVIIGDKILYNVSMHEGKAYLACSFGIVVIDLLRKRLVDSYSNLGPNGTNLPVTDVAIYNGFIYVTSNNGIYRANLLSLNLSDFSSWSLVKSTIFSNHLEVFNNQMFAIIDSTLYTFDGLNWSIFNNALPTFTAAMKVNNNKLIITNRNNIWIVNNQNAVTVNSERFANAALYSKEGDLYILVPDYFMIKVNSNTGQLDYLAPAGPYATTATRMAYNEGKLWIAGGSIGGFGVTGGWGPLYNNSKFYTFENNEWYNFKSSTDSRIINGRDFTEVVIDPISKNALLGSLVNGIIEINNKEVVHLFDSTNSPLRGPNTGGLGLVQVPGLAYDNDNNLWVNNFGAVTPLLVRTQSGQWGAFSFPTAIDTRTGFITCDDYNNKWITSTRGQGLIVYNSGIDPLNANDDNIKLLGTEKENGFLPSKNVLCITKDKEGTLWVGTDQGLCIIDRPQNVFKQGQDFDARQIIIKTGLVLSNFLGTTPINCIRVDAANRKWIGTQNGAWLVSPDGYTVIRNFNMSNSPLLSNLIYEIGIDEKTGEVFFATEKGLISYMGSATEGSDFHEDVLVFPNPVKPEYTGLITIRGLVSGAYVKIADINGHLVYETKANGGTATWDGRNFTGKRASTGVYLIYSSSQDGIETNVTKILFVN